MVANTWTKSTRSGPWTDNCVEIQWQTACESNNCVEVGWHKSEQSAANGGCVEVNCNCHNDEILVRDTKDRQGPVLSFTRDEWRAFIAGAKDGEFDLP